MVPSVGENWRAGARLAATGGYGRPLRGAAMLRAPITIVLRECKGEGIPPQPPTLVTAGTLKPEAAVLVLITILCPCHHPTPYRHHPSSHRVP